MKAWVTEKCDGSGLCIDVCPDVFEMGQDGKACVKVNQVPPRVEESCRDAKEACPYQAIEIKE